MYARYIHVSWKCISYLLPSAEQRDARHIAHDVGAYILIWSTTYIWLLYTFHRYHYIRIYNMYAYNSWLKCVLRLNPKPAERKRPDQNTRGREPSGRLQLRSADIIVIIILCNYNFPSWSLDDGSVESVDAITAII